MKYILPIVVAIALVVGIGSAAVNSSQDSATHQTVASDESKTSTNGSYIAGAYQKFSQDSYDQALVDGKTVILDFHADWCPTCIANKRIIEAAFDANTNTDLVGFQVNYDTQRALKREFNVTIQGIIIKTNSNGEVERLGPNPITAERFAAMMQS